MQISSLGETKCHKATKLNYWTENCQENCQNVLVNETFILPFLIIFANNTATQQLELIPYKWTKVSSLEIDIFDLKLMMKTGLDFFL